MSIAELKKEICKIVEETDDENRLEYFFEMMKVAPEELWWEDLNPQEQEDILESEKQIERGEFVDNEVVMDKLAKWLTK